MKSDSEIQEEHDRLLRLQKQALTFGYSEVAKDYARMRQELWETAQERGIDL